MRYPEPEVSFGALLNRYMKRKEMDLEDLAQALGGLGYSRDAVHPERMTNATTDHRYRRQPAIPKGIREVLELDSEEIYRLTDAYLYEPPPERPQRRRRR